jgi:choline dehydrogenase
MFRLNALESSDAHRADGAISLIDGCRRQSIEWRDISAPSKEPCAMASQNTSEYDYIVIGSGIGGCVVAGRLSEDPAVRVLLLEAGPEDNDPDIHATELTALFATWSKPQFDWGLSTVEEPGLDGRKMPIIQGRVAGGGSSLHGRIFIRGHRRDFDHWNYMGNENWAFDQVLPYFKKSEDYMGPTSEFRGVGGPMPVMDLPKERQSVASQAFVAGVSELGFQSDWDFNGPKQEGGAGYIQTTTTRDFKRASAYTQYIAPHVGVRKNLTVEFEAFATRLLFSGKRAVGVEYQQKGKTLQARAGHEVIVSMGPLNSPKLLMHSGIGAAEQLRQFDIPVLVDLKGVGENLQDHLNVRMCWASKVQQQIPMVICESSMFTFTRDGVPNASPDLQLFFGGFAFPGLGADFNKGFALVPVVCRPQSVGRVWLKSANPLDSLNIQTNYLTADYDMQVLLAGIRLGREIVATKAFDEMRGAELIPGPAIGDDEQKLRKYIRDTCITDWHPSGTCAMGLGNDAVVDPRLRVYGVDGLRVVDASVMPSVVSGNLQASIFMIGEKAAAMIQEDAAGVTRPPVFHHEIHKHIQTATV